MLFHKLTLSDKETIDSYLQQSAFRSCDYSFANLFIWADAYHETWALSNDMLVFKSTDAAGAEPVYMYPAGCGDLEKTVTDMLKDAHQNGSPLKIRGFGPKEAELLNECFPGKFEIHSPREEWDYLYFVDDLKNLSGSRYHGKRNHISQFHKHYPDFSYLPLTAETLPICYSFAKQWYQYQISRGNTAITADRQVVQNALDYFVPLQLTGGILSAGKNVVAFTIGEPLTPDTYVVHVEKALPYVKGAYPVINQQYVLHEMSGFTYVNREEDDGIPGLIRAKQSYHPVKMVEKHIAIEK